ncbi:MAG TPA: sigma 54-interacting transcriptional regulator [Candidatus Sulfotelmatobacter sp.]|nr:sigma 54-interacting transcriptional regulator [Candidatus Sulfotelmatobacter sp.]
MPNEGSVAEAGGQFRFAHPDALLEPEKLLAAYFRSSTMGLCVLDCAQRYLAINSTLANMNGAPAPEHIGKTVREMLGNAAGLVELQIQRACATGEPVTEIELSAVLPTRTETGHWIEHYFPIKDESGVVQRIAVVVIEVTEQKKLEQSLQDVDGKLGKQSARLQMLLDVSAILASNWDLQQVFPRISARIRRVLRHEYAGFELHEGNTGLLVRQAEDFPLGKGMLSSLPISPHNSPGGRALQHGAPLTFSREQMKEFQSEIAKSFIAEGLRTLSCIPMVRPKGPLGVLVLGSTRANAFDCEDLTLLNQVAAQFAVALENHRAAVEIQNLKDRLTEEKKYLEGDLRSQGMFEEIIGDSPALKNVLAQASTVAASNATVLILGETGTGKELIARALHRMSRRQDAPFIKLNCAAIPTGLLESELFGHEKGAFTGAISQKIGRMELADGGTLFLDEIGEIPIDVQPKLLRVLQDQEFERLGSNRTLKVDLRLVAATNRDLAKGIEQHEFRSDLFYRLNVFPIRLPALRERREDIPLLVRYFVRKFAARMERDIETIPKETMKILTEWPWPGNIRELENLMERSVILSDGRALRVPLAELRNAGAPVASQTDQSLDSAEREHIVRVLRETRGTLSGADGAAKRLGLKRTTLQSKMQRLKISRQDYADPE